ncbi:hypothetical protein ROS9278_04218 [Roseomonas sp. CECT 9278]|nr:hypothetical protein ROS9278_04218 [Roseomonas sp. CECT 9278]
MPLALTLSSGAAPTGRIASDSACCAAQPCTAPKAATGPSCTVTLLPAGLSIRRASAPSPSSSMAKPWSLMPSQAVVMRTRSSTMPGSVVSVTVSVTTGLSARRS